MPIRLDFWADLSTNCSQRDNDLLPDHQTAYRANYSIVTAVLQVLANILMALDSSDLAVLMLLDLSGPSTASIVTLFFNSFRRPTDLMW